MTMTMRGQAAGQTAPSTAVEVEQWRQSWPPILLGAGIAAGLLALAWRAFESRSIPAELAAVCAAVGVASMGVWGSGRGRDGIALRVALVAVIATIGAAFWGWGTLAAVATAVTAVAVAAFAGTYRRRLALRAQPVEWLVVGLASATGDRRHPTKILKPSGGSAIYPIRWNVPATLALHDPKTLEKVVDLIDARLGGKHHLNEGAPGQLLIVPASTTLTDEDSDDRPNDVRRLDDVLTAALGAGARVTSWDRDPDGDLRSVDLEWPAHLAGRLAGAAQTARLTRTMTRVLPGDWVAHWRLPDDQGRLERTERLPEYLAHIPRTSGMSATKVTFGQTLSGPATWDLDDAEPHMLIVGRTRGGKTSFARSLIAQLGHEDVEAEMILIDPKRSGLRGLEYLPGVAGRWSPRDLPAMIAKIESVYREMNRRYDQLDDGTPRSEIKRLVLVIDEGRTFYEITKTHWNLVEKPELLRQAKEDDSMVKPTGTEHPVVEQVRGILRLGGEAKINVIFITQQADADWLSTDARQNFGVRVALGNLDDEGLGMLYGKGTRLPRLSTRSDGTSIKGRAWVGIAGGTPRQVQIYWTPPPIAADLKPGDAEILRALGLPIHEEEQDSPDESEDLQASKTSATESTTAELEPEGHTAESEVQLVADPDDHGHDTPADDVETGAQNAEVCAVRDLNVGDRICVDHADARLVVEVIEVDDTDEDETAITWEMQDGGLGVLSVDPDDSVERISESTGE